MQDGSPFPHRRLLVGDRRQLLVRNLDCRNSVLRGVDSFGRDRCDRFSDIPDAISCKHWMQRYYIHAWSGPVTRQVISALQVAGRDHCRHSGHGPGDRRIDSEDSSMGMD